MLDQVGMTQKQAMWNCHGTWVMYHKSLEKLAAFKKLKFDKPELIHQDLTKKEVVLLVTGHCDGVSEWSYGEATPLNNKNAYPFAMAEKRAKDRVVLKLLGFHGDIYSDAELDDFWRKGKNEFQKDSDLCTQMMRACAEKRVWIQEKDAHLAEMNQDKKEHFDGETI